MTPTRRHPFVRDANRAKASSSSFLTNYIDLATHENNLAQVATWLFEHAREMNERMFFDPNVNWLALEPHMIFALRATAPEEVFTSTAKGGYLTQVGGDDERSALADYLFVEDDFAFARKLPADARAPIVQLMKLAYTRGIRPADARVKSM